MNLLSVLKSLFAKYFAKNVRSVVMEQNENKDLKNEKIESPTSKVEPDVVKNEFTNDFESLKKEFEALKTKVVDLEKDNSYLKNENKDLHKKVIRETIEASDEADEPLEPFNEFDPSTWPSNRKQSRAT